MFLSIDGFVKTWEFESAATQKMMDRLTDASLHQAVKPNDRTLGGLAWHIVGAIQSIMGQTGLDFEAPAVGAPVPGAREVADAYRKTSGAFIQALQNQWTDQNLMETCNMFGQFEWPKGQALATLVNHQIHHRGQMTVLMRQADLIVPGVYGPAKEEWSQLGMDAPEVVYPYGSPSDAL
ncbi:DinB family protein [Ammoniphilus sp. 3BR4]|uniref:DinB family protein n=1 Tax=Ammoniphilus sp. 3BR4 TaxID=3158265 RepID=UPI003466AD3E